MALSKVNFNSMNVTPAASKAIKFNSSNNGLETGDLGGQLQLLSTQTASDSATIDFTSGIDSTYKEYQFHYSGIHPATDGAKFGFQFNAAGQSGFNETLTSIYFRSYHNEAGNSTGFGYVASEDQEKSTGFLILDGGVGADNDQCTIGVVHLYNPSETTYTKKFRVFTTHSDVNDFNANVFVSGHVDSTTAIDEVQFKFSSGNIQSGTIKMYGVL